MSWARPLRRRGCVDVTDVTATLRLVFRVLVNIFYITPTPGRFQNGAQVQCEIDVKKPTSRNIRIGIFSITIIIITKRDQLMKP